MQRSQTLQQYSNDFPCEMVQSMERNLRIEKAQFQFSFEIFYLVYQNIDSNIVSLVQSTNRKWRLISMRWEQTEIELLHYIIYFCISLLNNYSFHCQYRYSMMLVKWLRSDRSRSNNQPKSIERDHVYSDIPLHQHFSTNWLMKNSKRIFRYITDQITYFNCALIERCSSELCRIVGECLLPSLNLSTSILFFENKKMKCTYSLVPFLHKQLQY